MAEKDFQLGDLVWAKMKNCPFWPAQIIIQPEEKYTTRKNQHLVFFYGSRNRGWVLDENIVSHSEEMLNKVPKKTTASLKKAIKQLIKASRGEDSAESDESTESPKINLKKRGRTSKRKMKRRKMTKSAQKPDASNKELSPVQNAAGVSNDYSDPISDKELAQGQNAAGVSNEYSAPISNQELLPGQNAAGVSNDYSDPISDKELAQGQNAAGVSNEYSAPISDKELFQLQSAAGVSNDYSAPISDKELFPGQNAAGMSNDYSAPISDQELLPGQNAAGVSNDYSAPISDKELFQLQSAAGVSNDYSAPISDKELFQLQSAAGVSNDYSAPISNTSNNIDFFCSGFSEESGYEYFPSPDYPTPSGEKLCETTSKKIGFIGLGAMGRKIVKKLLNSKHNVSIWNRTPDKCKEFVTAGAQQYNTPAELVWNCDIIFCCVSESEAVEAIIFGDCGILHGLEKSEPGSKGYIELTSMNPFTLLKIYAAITDKGGKYLEAPISDSISLVENGLPLINVAGDRQLLNDCVSCFLAIAERICFMNCEVGSASKMNIALSMVKGNTYALLAESMVMLDSSDLSKRNFLNVLRSGQMNCPDLLQKCQAMIQNDFTADTSLKYQQKDLELALQLSSIYQQPLPMTSAAHGLYKIATQRGYSECDVSALYLAKLKVN
ncbi:putative oxidoreductase GLYR1 [Trichonephila clavata]|uniref:Cytokine-like nuclear factor N-PAC n=1 Tax=Trichonephila clavata TaxID=2740835 RepID=A0A8X6LDD9_TRICU|nr:putative oxidoreductase GLYR1 [Trichonephila clavata]